MMTVRLALILACVLLLASGCVSRARYDESEARHRAAQEQIVLLEGERAAVKKRLLALEKAHNHLEGRSELMEEMISTLRNMNACIRRLQLEVEGQPRPIQ
jgi:outer membrane murein-binding lipoprotein Lpp